MTRKEEMRALLIEAREHLKVAIDYIDLEQHGEDDLDLAEAHARTVGTLCTKVSSVYARRGV